MPRRGNSPTAADPAGGDLSLIVLAELLLSDHFFDPDREHIYKKKLSENRPAGTTGVLLHADTIAFPGGTCDIRIEALRIWTHFRVVLSHRAFTATVEGAWHFDNEALNRIKVIRSGDLATIEAATDAMIAEIEDEDPGDEDFASFMNALDDDAEEVSLIGDDPTEPPPATASDRKHLIAIARRLGRKSGTVLPVEDRGWLEETPQVLPAIADLLIAAIGAAKRDEALIEAYQLMLSLQMEFVRYRQDRGWNWANAMLEAFQTRLIALGSDPAIRRSDWLTMCEALTEARVPVPDAVQAALANAGFNQPEDSEPPEDLLTGMRGIMDELARMVSSPFEAIHSLESTRAMMPAILRGFIATELALSSHPVLREAVPLMLLDSDAAVRRSAAAALEQTAQPETMSPDTLRRAIAIRNWIPAADRPALDAAIRKARRAGVEIGAWPKPVASLAFHASTIDGSAAQSILATGESGKTCFFGGVLLRYGVGVIDTWGDTTLSRGKINKLLREAKMEAPIAAVEKSYADSMIQHALGTMVDQATVPPALLLELAELIGGEDWKDRRIDVAARAGALFAAQAPADRTAAAVQAGLVSAAEWMASDPAFGSWFEEGPDVQKALATFSRTDYAGMISAVINDVLPTKRAAWAERFLMLALWCAASPGTRSPSRGPMLIAHALTGDVPIGGIPAMTMIAAQSVRAKLLGGW